MTVKDAKGWNFDMDAAPLKRPALYFHSAEYRRGQRYLNETVRLGLRNEWPSRPPVAWKDVEIAMPLIDYSEEKAKW